ncbi:MAG: peptidase [Paracoccus denitrificans]|uniref:Peptidase n=1 Tax=Paracoccus denitrificans TaxID=266 RepID=A0A533I7F1_PARDE|nr:MAG: peptidase [Paracoccus denitrificans]
MPPNLRKKAMTVWQIHFLNSRKALNSVMPEARDAAREAVSLVEEHVDLPRFDLVVRAGEDVVQGWAVGGYAPGPGHIQITLEPARFDPQYFIRTLVHELHHLLRWDGPGYGKSLGEALVSEGLAGHFVLQVLGGSPDPWDAVNPSDGVARRALNEWSRRDYDHAEWFFGKGRIRRWSGYGLGHRLISEYLAQSPQDTPVTLANAPVDRFRPAMRKLANSDGGAEMDAESQTEDPAAPQTPDVTNDGIDAEKGG